MASQGLKRISYHRRLGEVLAGFCCLLVLPAVCLLAEHVAPWDAASGLWEVTETEARGRGSTQESALLLSHDWYGDLQFSGEVQLVDNSQGRAAILVRYASRSESYALVLDVGNGRLSLEENHFGESRPVIAINVPNLRQRPRIHFRIVARGSELSGTVWADNSSQPQGTELQFGDLKIPEGRVGIDAGPNEIRVSELNLKGQTTSSYDTPAARSGSSCYAFHCNYRLAQKVADQPLWRYLDSLGSSLASRYARNFHSVEEFERHRKEVVWRLRKSLGLEPWPERNPLNARVIGVIDRDDYKIEKVIFESQPGFLVNAVVYLPKGVKGPVPGIVSTIGHYGDEGLFMWPEQGRCMGLARKGYVVVTYDPIGQGERRWLGDHNSLRQKIILAGMEVSGLLVWDAIRAIDYLSSRPEVDPERIGITGVSGGGFQALYTAVLDERVKAAAPDGFATSIEALIKGARAGCCAYLPEMNLYAEMQDVYSLIAPRKLLILGGYMDNMSNRILSIYEVARKVYRLYGAEQNLRYYLDPDAGHGYSRNMRLALYRHFNKWLKGVEDPAEAREGERERSKFVGTISRESGLLRVLPPSEKGKNVTDLMREYLGKHQVRHALPSTPQEANVFQLQLRKTLLGLMGDTAPSKRVVVMRDDRHFGPGACRRVLLNTERNLCVPLKIQHPPSGKSQKDIIVFFSMEERYPVCDLSASERVQGLVNKGFTVAVPEVRGTGQSKATDMYSVALFSMAVGKHLFSTRIYDLRRVLDYLLSQEEYQSKRLVLWGEGPREGLMALYLAAVDSRVDTVVSCCGLVSYQDIVDKNGTPGFDYYVPGLLKFADLPQIIGGVAPRRVLISSPVDINNNVLEVREARKAYAWAAKVYEVLGRPGNFSVVPYLDLQDALEE